VILERDGRSEHRHDAVAGELVHRGAVALDHRHRAIDQFRHDLAEPFGADHSRDAHRVHHVREEHRDLFVLGMGISRGHRRGAAMTEPSVLQGLGATRPARRHGRHPTLPHPHAPEFIQDRALSTRKGR